MPAGKSEIPKPSQINYRLIKRKKMSPIAIVLIVVAQISCALAAWSSSPESLVLYRGSLRPNPRRMW
jgi:hypothetical protein